MDRIIYLLLCLGLPLHGKAQFSHLDFLGAGHDNNVTVTTSSGTVSGQKTVDGFPIQNDAQLKDASRFLAQSTFGTDFATIEMTAAMGYEAWLDEQFNLPQGSMLSELFVHGPMYGESGSRDEAIGSTLFRSVWLTHNMTSPDWLRQRMAFALSQIMVVNDNSDLFEDWGQIISAYYDMLSTNSFGNYQDLLLDVTLSPAMGIFLSHFGNPKEDLSQNIHPDENYAREIMQLFSIGLWELNPDGTRKYDAQGAHIPTYTNSDIKEFAQVFTGLASGDENSSFGGIDEESGNFFTTITAPMKMYETHHDNSTKNLLNGYVIPANQPGMTDVEQTIAHLATHPNTAPFISKSLIKRFTTSNPSPAYVSDIAAVFNPGEANNFQEVIKAILLHPEARNCNITSNYTFGKLREPIVRYMNFMKAFHMKANENSHYANEMICFNINNGQAPLDAPSVFNFYRPDYKPQGPIGQSYLTGPEFQILNATNAIGLINDINLRTVTRAYMRDECVEAEYDPEEEDDEEDGEAEGEYIMDYSDALALTDDPVALVNYLDILIANGLLEDDTKSIISNAVSQLNDSASRLKMALYLILVSPDYAILK